MATNHIKKTTNIIIITFILGIIVFITSFLVGREFIGNEENVDYHAHAGFLIYVDGELLDLTADKYMNYAKCTIDEKKEKTIKDKIHLHDKIGNVAHIHSENVIWKDLFTSLELEAIENRTPTIAYLNGQETNNLQNKIINSYDSVIFVFGDVPQTLLPLTQNAVTKDQILDAEKLTESCGL